MLERLLETGVQRKKSAWGAIVSAVVHGAIIVLAVAATAMGTPAPRARIVRDPSPIYVDQTAAHQSPPQGRESSGGTARGPLAPPGIPLPGRSVDIDTPLPNPSGTTGFPGADTDIVSEIGGTGGGGDRAHLDGSGIATDASVDTPVTALAARAPAYPETLRAAGIAGTVRVRFVVDTTGRAEPSSIRVLESTHELFTRAVVASLRQARFTPGAVAGHRVRTLVERSYRFDIADGAR